MKLSVDAAKGYLAAVLAQSSPPWELLGFKSIDARSVGVPAISVSEVLEKGFHDPAPALSAESLKRVAPLLPHPCDKASLLASQAVILEPLAFAITTKMSLIESLAWLKEEGAEWKLILELLEPVLDKSLLKCEDAGCLYLRASETAAQALLECDESNRAANFITSYFVLRFSIDSALLNKKNSLYTRQLEERIVENELTKVVEKAISEVQEQPLNRIEIELRAWRELYMKSGASSWTTLGDMIAYYSTLLYYLGVVLRRAVLGGEAWVLKLRERSG
ncbi:MAG: hypothetical protein QW065_05525 [Acidilobaceae archaeon]